MGKYFKTDGIRFIYDEKSNTFIHNLALSLNSLKSKKIIIGYDTRCSSKDIFLILSTYLDCKKIINVGIIATPGISYLSDVNKCLGVMITASHNPYEYNGIKLFINGEKINDKLVKKIEKEIDKEKELISKELIDRKIDISIKKAYIDFLEKHIEKSNKKIIFDCGNGSVSQYIESIAYNINRSTICINNSPNGYNINYLSGALHPELLKQKLIELNYDYGFCFDGDGDRLILVTQNEIYNGDKIIEILIKNNYHNKKSITLNNLANLGFLSYLRKNKIKYFLTDIGDKFIYKNMKKYHQNLGGETSGHIIIRNKLKTSDALLNSLILISIFNKDISPLLDKSYIEYPSCSISLKNINHNLLSNKFLLNIYQELQDKYKDVCNIILRFSGTENLLRLSICSSEQLILNKIKTRLITAIKLIDSNSKFDDISSIIIDEHSTLGSNNYIQGNTIILNSIIGENNSIISSTIKDSQIGSNNSIGPYSHIKNKSVVNDNVRIGNYVEIKNSFIDHNTKVAHLAYIGDSIVGKNVNFGCGAITVNYDGKKKHMTIIEDNAFIGSNVNLIAPIKIGENSFIAAGTTLTSSTKKNTFSISRSKQKNTERKKDTSCAE